ncbi:MAG: hypothetical protein QOD59_5194, partial [Mycobacterium sp.]|nr:hypothetical protein [Mycobacterium sp.]
MRAHRIGRVRRLPASGNMRGARRLPTARPATEQANPVAGGRRQVGQHAGEADDHG